jgi:hypothetical protein
MLNSPSESPIRQAILHEQAAGRVRVSLRSLAWRSGRRQLTASEAISDQCSALRRWERIGPLVTDVVGLRSTLDDLARTTWTDIADGRRLGLGMGEVGITDRNMLALRREHPSLLIHKHPAHEEVRTGADWEWWLAMSGGWICLVFQAKVLDANGRYPGITKGQAEGKPQVDVLVRSCLLRSERLNGAVWPFYCFYNSWSDGWPEDIKRFDGADPRAMPIKELQLYGCAVVNAWSVRRVLFGREYSNRRTLRNSYLPISRPWSMIFPDSAKPMAYIPGDMNMMLSSWMLGRQNQIPPAPALDDQHGTQTGEVQRRDRLAIYRDPAPIDQPPDYVLDLLEGRSQPRRLKPLARRVAILPELI